MHRVLQPAGWDKPKGYVNGVAARGTVIAVAGQVGWTARSQIIGEDFVAQARQALSNIVAILAEAGAGPQHIVRMTWYVTDKVEYLAAGKALGAVYRELMTGPDAKVNYPAMSAVQVAGLVEEGAKLEIEATAVVPD
ncbi:MAG: RidA family protein [Burkholderiaceae bacterium]|nr:RidA family protein [Burkholderiaceae bacterium]